MVETKAKIWFKNKKNNVIEVTALDNTIALDVFLNKKKVIKHHFNIIKHIITHKEPNVKDEQELADSINVFIDEYYEDEQQRINLKNYVLEELQIKPKEVKNISYIG